METRTKILIDPITVERLDRWRRQAPTISRTSLVNQVLVEWLNERLDPKRDS